MPFLRPHSGALGQLLRSPEATRASITLGLFFVFFASFLATEFYSLSPVSRIHTPLTSSPISKSLSSSAMSHFSIWAMPPDGSQFQQLSTSAIKTLSSRMKCTPFEPHVTVIGAFGADQGLSEAEVLSRTQQLCRTLKPYVLRVKELTSGKQFFQCVYLKMLPTEEVMHVNMEARKLMGMDLNGAYMPHQSLIYGDLTEEQKEEVKGMVASEFSGLLDGEVSIPVNSLALYRTDPNDLNMSSWERIQVFPLEG